MHYPAGRQFILHTTEVGLREGFCVGMGVLGITEVEGNYDRDSDRERKGGRERSCHQ